MDKIKSFTGSVCGFTQK